jgi:hypothetical protein
MFIGMAVASLGTALAAHAVAAPVIFSMISWFYFAKLRYTSPLQTSAVFVLIVVLLDFFVVALVINRSLEMFQSVLGTWIPWGLIFLSTYLTSRVVEAQIVGPEAVG